MSKKDKKKRKNKQVLLQNLEMYESDDNEELVKLNENQENILVGELKEKKDSENEELASTSKKTKKKDKKGKKAPVEDEILVPDEADNKDNTKCTVCLEEFETRNKLFSHIKSEGHTSVPTLSYNQIKKQRILLAKMSKAKK